MLPTPTLLSITVNTPLKNPSVTLCLENGWKNVYSLSDLTPEEIQESLKDYGIFLYDHMNALMEDEDYDMQLYKY